MDLISNIKLFIKVAEKGSFSEVARINNMSKASVTRQINFLEKELNTRLLQRSTRHVSLTDSGKDYYLKINKLVEQFDEINHSLISEQGIPNGTVRVSCSASFSLKYIIPHIAEFYNLYPNVKLSFLLEDKIVNLLEDEIDVAIRIGAVKDSSMIIYPLTSNNRAICASPEYLDKFSRPKNLDDLKNHNCLIIKSMPLWYFFKDSDVFEIKPNSIIETNNGDALRLMALSGLGLVVLPMWLIKDDLKNNRLESILSPEYIVNTSPTPDSEIYILYPAKEFLPLRVKVFISFIKKCMKLYGVE